MEQVSFLGRIVCLLVVLSTSGFYKDTEGTLAEDATSNSYEEYATCLEVTSGGNPNQVTIFAASSGAICVHLLTLSNLTNGVFHRYITQSGSALAYTSTQPLETYKNYAFQLGKHLGCPTNTSAVLVDCFRGLNASQLINTNSLFYEWKTTPDIVWDPTVEPVPRIFSLLEKYVISHIKTLSFMRES